GGVPAELRQPGAGWRDQSDVGKRLHAVGGAGGSESRHRNRRGPLAGIGCGAVRAFLRRRLHAAGAGADPEPRRPGAGAARARGHEGGARRQQERRRGRGRREQELTDTGIRKGRRVLKAVTQAGCGLAAIMWLAAANVAGAQESVSALKEHDTRSPIDISADRLEVRSKDDLAVFEGRVEAVQKDLTLKADRITVYYDKAAGQKTGATNSGESPPISRIDAAGKVTLVSPSKTVAANWGVYDMVERIVTLGGAVVLNRGDVVVRGDRLQVNLES